MGIEQAQPTGEVCRDCHESMRRGFPGTSRAEVLRRVQSDAEFRDGEFAQARATYQSDMQEKIQFGSLRLKKRVQTVKKEDKVEVNNKMKGTMMELAKYHKAGTS